MTNGKFTKDEMQKMVLSSIGFVALLYVYFTFFLGPLNRSRAAMEKRIEDLESKLASSKLEIAKTAGLEKQAAAAIDRFAAMQALTAEGAPIAWFPPRIKLLLANQQIEKSTVRAESNGAYKQPELADWDRYTWLVDLPKTDFITLGTAIARLENSEPLLSIAHLSITGITESPQYQQVILSTNIAIAKK